MSMSPNVNPDKFHGNDVMIGDGSKLEAIGSKSTVIPFLV
jgi:hypothetical protein